MLFRPIVFGLLCMSLAGACSGRKDSKSAKPQASVALTSPRPAWWPQRGRLVILGFDGVDPRWVEEYVAQGKLPHIKQLQGQGTGRFRSLASTIPPQSPVAWATFATGTRPGEHGIYDFVGRDLPSDPSLPVILPKVATTSFATPDEGPPVAKNLRHGQSFWQNLGNHGVAVEAINIPYSFPPEPVVSGRILSGLGTPDLRGSNSTFTMFATDFSASDLARPPGGGQLVPMRFENGRAQLVLDGPTNHRGVTLGARLELVSEASGFTLRTGEGATAVSTRLQVGSYSSWLPLVFREEGKSHVVRGLVRTVLLAGGTAPRLFVTPISIDPAAPYSDVSFPRSYGQQWIETLGHAYKTVGWDHDTNALNAEAISDELFLADMDIIEADRRSMLEDALSRNDSELVVWVSTATDRVAHMFYRFRETSSPRYDAEAAARVGDPIAREYERMDATIAMVQSKLGPNDTLLILSDHGFHGFLRGLHVNQWLLANGYLVLKEGKTSGDVLRDTDWSQTRAYGLGTGQIYLNRRGREREGIVDERQVAALVDEIRTKLLALRDEERGSVPVIAEVYRGSQVFTGANALAAPDLQVAFSEGYRTSWESILGGVEPLLFADNDKKWSGDHSASATEDTPGILLSNRALRTDVSIEDLAPTALDYFEKPSVPAHLGQSVFAH